MSGIVQDRIALANKRNVGMRKVHVQYLSISNPMTTDPTELPSLPTIIEMQIAIALEEK